MSRADEMMRRILGVALLGLASAVGAAEAAGAETSSAAPVQVAQAEPTDAEAAYRAAREALSRGDYERAVERFQRFRERFPQAGSLPEAYYWEAFARYRLGALHESLRLLETQLREHSTAAIAQHARELQLRVESLLARQGDARAAERASREVERALLASGGSIARAQRAEAMAVRAAAMAEAMVDPALAAADAVTAPALAAAQAAMEEARARDELRALTRGSRQAQEGCEDDDVRRAAINALLQMDSERAVPVLRRVLERRDKCSAPLRKQAVFVLAQQGGPDVEEVMLDVVRNDPDSDVREAAVFWLSQVGSERAVDALADVLETSDDPRIQDKAVFALSQHPSERAGDILRRYALDATKPDHIREKAIFWLGQHPSYVDSRFLIDLYGSLESDALKEKVFFALSQRPDQAALDWMLERARDTSEEVDVRKKALFWAVQGGVDVAELDGLYATLPDREMKEQVIFLYSQRSGPAAVERLIEIARNEEDPELRKKAIFWLGQSRDERAAEFLLELLEAQP